MTAYQLKVLENKLAAMGYTKYQNRLQLRREDYYWCKGFDYYKIAGGVTPRYQVFYLVYDWRKYGDRAVGGFKRNEISVPVVVVMGNWYNGQADLDLTEDRDVQKIEKIAASYVEWVKENLAK